MYFILYLLILYLPRVVTSALVVNLAGSQREDVNESVRMEMKRRRKVRKKKKKRR